MAVAMRRIGLLTLTLTLALTLTLTLTPTLTRIGLVGELTVVANLGDARMRARLAKGTLNALGAHEILVGD